MSLLRAALRSPLHTVSRLHPHALAGPSRAPLARAPLVLPQRTYAKKAKSKSKAQARDEDPAPAPAHAKHGVVDTGSLVPGSQQALADPAAQAEYERADAKMKSAVEWFRREVAQLETRASGRVTPQLLAPVRVTLPSPEAHGHGHGHGHGHEHGHGHAHEHAAEHEAEKVKLEEVATVGVRDGSMLIVTVFDTHTLKAVETAIYDAKLPNIVPQRADERTLRIPIPKPTVDARLAMYTVAARHAEESRMQIRKQHQASLKKGKYAKHSVEIDEFQKLHDRYTQEVDSILAGLKKSTGAR